VLRVERTTSVGLNPQELDVSEARAISIIDDDESVRSSIEDLVSSLGYVAHVFGSAEQFLNSPDHDETACLITDLQMPGMSGQDLQRRLLAEGCHVPIIFITAFPENHIRDSVLAKGALAFLEKPFDCGRLVTLIRRAMTSDDVAARE
jgi:FixJ family two-component response regulator